MLKDELAKNVEAVRRFKREPGWRRRSTIRELYARSPHHKERLEQMRQVL